jgi:hypothetical protein
MPALSRNKAPGQGAVPDDAHGICAMSILWSWLREMLAALFHVAKCGQKNTCAAVLCR